MGWMELMMIGVVALIVVGPKDLPVMFQSLGKMTAKIKRMGREFSSAMNDAANSTGANDIAKDLKGITSAKSMGIDKLKDAADKFDKWEPGKENRVMGSETAKLAAKRAEQTRKIQENMRQKGQEKLDKEKATAEAAELNPAAKTTKPKTTKAKTTKAKTTKPATTKPATTKAKPTTATKAKPAATTKAKPAAKAKTTAKAKPAAKPATKRATKPKADKTT